MVGIYYFVVVLNLCLHKKISLMKWLDNKIMVISFVWWLLQGSLLLLNELRVWFEYNDFGPISFILINISLIVVAFLLLYVKNKYIILLLSILLVLYSIRFLLICILLVLKSGWKIELIPFLLIPILNVFLSYKLMARSLKRL